MGIAKGDNTRSGMLWEVERMLLEIHNEDKPLPQILIMENVPGVIGSKNIKHFAEWVKVLDKLGYHSKWQLLNGKDYGIPQNRLRCFMVSIQGDYYYEFPETIPLTLRLKDMLEDNVDEKYYLSNKTIDMFVKHMKKKQAEGCAFKFEPTDGGGGYAKCILTRAGQRTCDNFITHQAKQIDKETEIANTIMARDYKGFGNQAMNGVLEVKEQIALDEQNSCSHKDGTIGTLTTDESSPKHNNRVVEPNTRIRKLTEKECFRLMGVKDEDFDKIAKNQSASSLYHLAGDSIIVNVLMAIFKQML